MCPDTSQRTQRQHSLEFQIHRLAQKSIPLQARSNRIAWSRLAIVVVGVTAAYLSAMLLNATVGWSIVLLTILVFTAVALYHRRLEDWIETLAAWRQIKVDSLARMTLDWENVRAPAPLDLHGNKSLALDLDLTGYRSLHQLLNTTLSRQGCQRLADWLVQPRPDLDAIHIRQEIVRELIPFARFRDRFQLLFRRVLREPLEGENLLKWLEGEYPSRRLKWMLPVAAVLVLTNLVLFSLSSIYRLPPYWIISLLLYFAFFYFNRSYVGAVLASVVRLESELGKFSALLEYLERASYAKRPRLAALCAPFVNRAQPPSAQLRKLRRVTAGVGLRSNPILGVLLNVILPWDFAVALFADRFRQELKHSFPVWVDTIQELDALCALANFGYLNPEYAFPEITRDAQPILKARGLGHPLIPVEQCVCNDFLVEHLGEVAIITGSNMAGKSTFIKTVGINLCLAYAGAPVCAADWRSLLFRLLTCIRISDSIADGFSYFYAEVKCLKALLRELEAQDELPLLYLIDEIFRGTNNRERLLGSRAYIQRLLGAHGVGLLATHDLELAHLADENPQARNYHFRDEVRDSRLAFDYAIRPGPCPTTNALKIMALEGLPVP